MRRRRGPLWRLMVRSLSIHRWRLLMSVVAVVLGTAFVSGSLAFGTTLDRTYQDLLDSGTKGVSVRIKDTGPPSPGVPLDLGDRVADIPGVDRIEPLFDQPVAVLDRSDVPVPTVGRPATGIAWSSTDQSVREPPRISEGRTPRVAGEVAIPRSIASAAGYGVGDEIGIVTASRGIVRLMIVGLHDGRSTAAGSTEVALSSAQALELFTDGRHAQAIDVAATPETDNGELRDRIAAAFPEFAVVAGDELRGSESEGDLPVISFISYFFVAIGSAALLVGSFTIYNTFAMVVTQRQQELGLLRAVGASRHQVTRLILGEAGLVGLIGAAVGVATGIALAAAVLWGLDQYGMSVPTIRPAVTPENVLLALAAGAVTSTAAAWVPARRAGTVPPVIAMRPTDISAATPKVWRIVVGTYLGVVGLLLVAIATLSNDTVTAVVCVGLGGAALTLGAYFILPALMSPLSRATELVITALFGRLGRLASRNVRRQPERAATTAFSLALGLFLVAAFGIIADSASKSLDSAVSKGIDADVIVTPLFTTGVQLSLPEDIPTRVLSIDGVDAVVSRSVGAGMIAGQSDLIPAVDGVVEDVVDAGLLDGSLTPGPQNIVVSMATAAERGWVMGAQIPVTSYTGDSQTVTVSGIYRESRLFGDWYTAMDTYEMLVPAGSRSTSSFFIKTTPGFPPSEVRDRVTAALDDSPMMMIQTKDELLDTARDGIQQLTAVIYAALSLAVLVAVLGITNALALAAVERRDEIVLLRSIGTQRSQILVIFAVEAFQLALLGSLIGLTLGVLVGRAFVHSLAGEGLGVASVPVLPVATVSLAALLCSGLAALVPAALASRCQQLSSAAL